MTPGIKMSIWQFVVDNLPSQFAGKIYWANERKNAPEKPFCLLRCIVPEQNTSRSSEQEIAKNAQEVTMYKSCVVTMSIYVDGLEDVEDLDEQNQFAHNTARNLRNVFETLDTAWTLGVEGLSVNSVSSLRDLTMLEEGGYTYRYEFDVTFGYNEVMIIQKEVGKDVNLQIERKTLND